MSGEKRKEPRHTRLRQRTTFLLDATCKLYVWGKKERAPPHKAETTYNILAGCNMHFFLVFADIPPHKAEVDLSEHKRQKLMLNCRGRLYVSEKKRKEPRHTRLRQRTTFLFE